MRQSHVGGDKLFVDYAGDSVPVIVDRLSGETRQAQIFVAVMGASNFTYADASWTQTLGDWIGAWLASPGPCLSCAKSPASRSLATALSGARSLAACSA
jgi:hypothetical protein